MSNKAQNSVLTQTNFNDIHGSCAFPLGVLGVLCSNAVMAGTTRINPNFDGYLRFRVVQCLRVKKWFQFRCSVHSISTTNCRYSVQQNPTSQNPSPGRCTFQLGLKCTSPVLDHNNSVPSGLDILNIWDPKKARVM